MVDRGGTRVSGTWNGFYVGRVEMIAMGHRRIGRSGPEIRNLTYFGANVDPSRSF